jgi:hypothetical protein
MRWWQRTDSPAVRQRRNYSPPVHNRVPAYSWARHHRAAGLLVSAGALVTAVPGGALQLAGKDGHGPTATTIAATTTTQPSTGGSGALVAGLDTDPSNDANAINQIGRTPALINAFFGFTGSTGSPSPFPTTYADSIVSLDSTPMITWQPYLPTQSRTSVLTSLSNGSQDSYIASWAQAAKAVNHKVYVRFMHEMNGTWYPWGAVAAGKTVLPGGSGTYPYTNTPQMYVDAFRHVVSIFQRVGATNVEFVWCMSSGAPSGGISSYYPGDSYASWASIDGYNKDAIDPKTFYAVFSGAYSAIKSFTAKRILIAETASVEFSGLATPPTSKAQWITDGFLNTIPSLMPQVKAVDYYDSPGNSDLSLQIDTSSASLQAVRQVFASSLYGAAAP